MSQPPVLPPACPGEMRLLESAAGPVALYAAGTAEGTPLLLVHSVNAAASAAEVRPIYDHFAASRPVYALDLPGYGHSDRSDRPYTIRLMTDAVLAAQAAVAARHGGTSVHALAVSLGCEFLARAAVERPAAFASLALVSPTAFNDSKPRRGTSGSSLGVAGLYRVLSSSLLSDTVFNNLTRPGVIRFFLEKTWGSKAIDETMWRYDCLTTRMPGAKHAPLRFVSAFLFGGDAFTLYEALSQPVWMSHGVRGDFTDYRLKRLFEARANWRITEYPTGAMPYFEIGPRFMADYASFLGERQATVA